MKKTIILFILISLLSINGKAQALTFEYDGSGTATTTSGGGGNSNMNNNDYTLKLSNMLKISIVELNGENGFTTVDSYILINRVRASNEKNITTIPDNSAFNTAANKFIKSNNIKPCSYYDIDPNNGDRIILRQLSCEKNAAVSTDLKYFYDSNPYVNQNQKNYLIMNEDIVEFETQCSSTACSGFDANSKIGTWFALHGTSYANISYDTLLLKHLEANNNKIFYWILYPLVNKRNGVSKIPGINVSSVNDLKKMLSNLTKEQKIILQNYRIIIEPIYYFGQNSTGNAKFATTKAMARNVFKNINEFGGYYFINFAKNFYSSNKHGIINSAGHNNNFNNSSKSGSDKYTGIGYMVVKIINDDEPVYCDKTKECCFDSSGKYHNEFTGDKKNYRCLASTGGSCPTSKLQKCNLDCSDTKSNMKCTGETGTTGYFHENDNLKDCTLNESADSGFDLIKKSDTKINVGGVSKYYCQVSCKDDVDISYPTNRKVFAGQYFLLENYVPTINIKRTCVTSKIDFEAFKNDLVQLENNYNEYKKAIQKFKQCFTWLDNDDLSMNDLNILFSYDNDAFNLFASGKELLKSSNAPTYTIKYWSGSNEPNNTYDDVNSTSREEESLSVLNSAFGDRIKMKFIKNTYIKRIEEKKFTFTIPQLYSLIPSGRVVSIKPNSSYELLEKNAVPISLSTKKGTYNYRMIIEGISPGNRSNSSDTFESRVRNAGVLQYKCNYSIDNDLYYPPNSPGDGNTPSEGKINFFYRPVDMSDINPNNRALGYNWKDYNEKIVSNSCISKECRVNESMKETAADYQALVNKDKDKFEFILTPGIMSDIRNYNVKETHSGGYSDWKMNCVEGGLYYYCKSNLLTCLSSSGTQNEGAEFEPCNTIFSNHNMASLKLTYDSSELLKNRNILMEKLEGFKSR